MEKVWEPELEKAVDMIQQAYDITSDPPPEDPWSQGYHQCMGDLLSILRGYSCFVFEDENQEDQPPVT